SEPGSDAVRRVRSRLDKALLPATAELSHLPQVSAASVSRVRARLAESTGARRRPVLPWVGAGLAFAAVGSVVAGWWGLSPEPYAELDLVGSGVDHVAGDRLALVHDGQGHAVVDGDRIRVDWEYGRLDLDAPADLTLDVRTPEGAVQVAGGSLVVVRDAV